MPIFEDSPIAQVFSATIRYCSIMIRISFIFVFISLFLCTHHMQAQTVAITLADLGLKGPVVSIGRTNWEVENQSADSKKVKPLVNEDTPSVIYEFDQKGRVSQSLFMDENWDEISKTGYTYEGNKLVKIDLKKKVGGNHLTGTLEYDSFGNLTSEEWRIFGRVDHRRTFSYDDQHNLILKREWGIKNDVRWQVERNFNARNQLISSKQYDRSGNVAETFTYTYDSAGNILQTEQTLAEGKLGILQTQVFQDSGWVSQRTVHNRVNGDFERSVFTYDAHGNKIKQEDYDKNDRLLRTYEWAYEYDAHGNWTSRKFIVNGTFIEIYESRITYAE